MSTTTRWTATAVVDMDRYAVFPTPSLGVFRAAQRWALAEAKKPQNTFPKKRNIGGWMFTAQPTHFETGPEGSIHVEAICTNFTGR